MDVLVPEELVIKEVSAPVIEEGALIVDPVAPSLIVEVAEPANLFASSWSRGFLYPSYCLLLEVTLSFCSYLRRLFFCFTAF